jgi:hypothetical protein
MTSKSNRGRRAAIVAAVVLVPALGLVGSAWATQTFSDVPPTHPFYAEIEWGAANGIINGFDDGTFRPSNNVTRQAVAAFVARYNQSIHVVANETDPESATSFTVFADCPPGERVIGGSGDHSANNLFVTDTFGLGTSAYGMRWETENDLADDPARITVYAVCAPALLP